MCANKKRTPCALGTWRFCNVGPMEISISAAGSAANSKGLHNKRCFLSSMAGEVLEDKSGEGFADLTIVGCPLFAHNGDQILDPRIAGLIGLRNIWPRLGKELNNVDKPLVPKSVLLTPAQARGFIVCPSISRNKAIANITLELKRWPAGRGRI